MSSLLFLPLVALAGFWVATEARRPGPRDRRALRVGWQLAALSFVPGPDWLGGERGPTLVVAALVVASLVAVGVAVLDRASTGGVELAVAPWVVAYAVVLVVAALLSTSPGVAGARSIRVVALLAIFAQTAVGLERAVVRRLFGQLMAGLAAAVVVGGLLFPDEAFASIQAPVIRVILTAPILGAGAHTVAAVGLGVLAALAWRFVDGERPKARTTGWWLSVVLPLVVGPALLLLSQKRAFWLAAVAAAVVAVALYQRRRVAVVLAGLMLVGGLFATVDPLRDLWDRERARPQVDNIASIRGAIFDASLDRWAERPVVGGGLGVGNSDLSIDVGQPGFRWNSHSEVGAALAAGGVLGLAAVAWGHVHGLLGAVRARRDPGRDSETDTGPESDSDPWPLVVVAGSLALLPFVRILQEPLIESLPLLSAVFPFCRWSTITIGPGFGVAWRRAAT